MSSFTRGILYSVDEKVDLSRSILVAEVYSRALTVDDGGYIACYVLAHGLEPDEAERAMEFFSAQPSLIVDAQALVDDARAEFPALVVIRWAEDTPGYLATSYKYHLMRELPSDDVISPNGWDLFWAMDAMRRGGNVPEAEALPPFDYRALRRKVMALRASVSEDLDPWLTSEYKRLREFTASSPEGSEALVALADDIKMAMDGEVGFAEAYAVVIPTKVERQREIGAILDWVPQSGREIVVAHGLDPIQAARVHRIVSEDPEAFVSDKHILSGARGRESLLKPLVVPDSGLNWMSADFEGRRSSAGYAILQRTLNLSPDQITGQHLRQAAGARAR